MMKGKSNVMYRATRADARQGTRMVLLPARIDRMRVLARGVLVTDVSRPAQFSKSRKVWQYAASTHRNAFPYAWYQKAKGRAGWSNVRESLVPFT